MAERTWSVEMNVSEDPFGSTNTMESLGLRPWCLIWDSTAYCSIDSQHNLPYSFIYPDVESYVITGERLSFNHNLPSVLIRPIEARHQEMKIRREASHDGHLAPGRPNDWRHVFGGDIVDM